MKTSIIIANWKMKLTPKESVDLAKEIKQELTDNTNSEVALCPSFVSLIQVGEILSNSKIKLGAQDAFWDEKGAYTGEVSPRILREAGCQYVIIGHSERRQNLGETYEMINKKVDACLENNMTPIVCVGETQEERRNNQTDNIVSRQLQVALSGIDLGEGEELIIAYEPIWAIGTGQSVEPEDAKHVFEVVRRTLIDTWPQFIVEKNIRLIYGGSVDANNVNGFNDLELCSGYLVGTASLKVDEFVAIIKKS